MSTPLIVALGAFAGLTVFLGLPFARLKNLPNSMQAFLTACATGILIFLLYDVISKASEPINEAITLLQQGKGSVGSFLFNVVVFVAGLGVGLMGLVYFERWFIRRPSPLRGRFFAWLRLPSQERGIKGCIISPASHAGSLGITPKNLPLRAPPLEDQSQEWLKNGSRMAQEWLNETIDCPQHIQVS